MAQSPFSIITDPNLEPDGMYMSTPNRLPWEDSGTATITAGTTSPISVQVGGGGLPHADYDAEAFYQEMLQRFVLPPYMVDPENIPPPPKVFKKTKDTLRKIFW